MQRSHMARKHRNAKDRTDEGVFDSAAEASASQRRALQKSLSGPTRQSTVRHKLAGGIATTFLKLKSGDGSSSPGTPGSEEGSHSDDGGEVIRGTEKRSDGVVGVGGVVVDVPAASVSTDARPPRAPALHIESLNSSDDGAKPPFGDFGAESVTKRRARVSISQLEEEEEAEASATPRSTQRAPSRSLREYESLYAAEDSPERAASPSNPSVGTLMEELLDRGSGQGGAEVTRVDVKKVKGVALMLEVAKADDLQSVLGCVEEYGLELTSVQCVNASGSSALHATASGGALRVARHLVTKVCVDVNATDNWGNTPLDEAQRAGKEEMCRFLVAAGGHSGSRSDAFSKQPFAVRTHISGASPAGSRGGSVHGGDIAYLPLNHSPAEVTRTNSSTNLALLDGGAESPRAQPRRRMRRRNSLSDLCLENLRQEQGLRSPPDAAYAAIRAATAGYDAPSTEPALSPASPALSPTSPTSPTSPDRSMHTTISEAPDAHDEWEVMAWDVRVDRKVGEGAFGEIRRATWRGVDVAVKTLKADCLSDAIALKEFNREMSIWSRLVHPNVVQFLGVGYKHDTPRLMLCEFMEGGSLQQKLMQMNTSGKKFLFDQGFAVIKGIASAMTYMHSRRPFAVIHRDLKPANILLNAAGEAKVADFGLSKMLDIDTPRGVDCEKETETTAFDDSAHDETTKGERASLAGGADCADAVMRPARTPLPPPSPAIFPAGTPARAATPEERAAHELLETRRLDYGEQVYSQLYDHEFLMTGETGAYKYMAPEVFKNELYGLKCDVYSFAMIAYEVFEGIMLMRDPVSWAHGASGPDEMRPAWMFLPAYDTRRTAECIELLEQCWHGDAKERPTFMKIGSEFRRIARISRSERPRSASASKKKIRSGSSGSKVGSLKTGSGGSGSLAEAAGGEDEHAPQCKCAIM
jgi:serine/threonine protein kinase